MQERIKKLKEGLANASAADLFPEYFVGDSELYCRKSLEDAKKDDVRWITRVPDTVSDVEECPEEILHIYMKEQQVVERGFRFLKDPAYFAEAFFLKSPRRVAALLCVMTIALLLYALAQRRLRIELKKKKMTLPNQLGKPTSTPTLRWVNQKFEGVDVTRLRDQHRTRFVFHRLDVFKKNVLAALGPKYQTRYSEVFVT